MVFLFWLSALCLGAGALGTIFFPRIKGAVLFFVLALLGGCSAAIYLHAPLVSLSILLWALCAFLLLRRPALPDGSDIPERRYWGGLMSFLFFIVSYRVLIGSTWGQIDRSASYLLQDFSGRSFFLEALRTLWGNQFWPLALLVAATLFGFLRKEQKE